MIVQAVITQSSEAYNQANASVWQNITSSTSHANPVIIHASIAQAEPCMNAVIATMLSLLENSMVLTLHATVLQDTQNPQLKLPNAPNATELVSLAAVKALLA